MVFFYPCPHCGHSVPLVAPVQPATVRCDACSRRFPIIPVDERAQRYFKVVTNNGRACIDPDFA
nr:hypothetical protein [Desulfobaculum xiamenense]